MAASVNGNTLNYLGSSIEIKADSNGNRYIDLSDNNEHNLVDFRLNQLNCISRLFQRICCCFGGDVALAQKARMQLLNVQIPGQEVSSNPAADRLYLITKKVNDFANPNKSSPQGQEPSSSTPLFPPRSNNSSAPPAVPSANLEKAAIATQRPASTPSNFPTEHTPLLSASAVASTRPPSAPTSGSTSSDPRKGFQNPASSSALPGKPVSKADNMVSGPQAAQIRALAAATTLVTSTPGTDARPAEISPPDKATLDRIQKALGVVDLVPSHFVTEADGTLKFQIRYKRPDTSSGFTISHSRLISVAKKDLIKGKDGSISADYETIIRTKIGELKHK